MDTLTWDPKVKGSKMKLNGATATGASQAARGSQPLSNPGSFVATFRQPSAGVGSGLGGAHYVGLASAAFTNMDARYDEVRDATDSVWAVQDKSDEDDMDTCKASWAGQLNSAGRVFGHDDVNNFFLNGSTLTFQRGAGR